MARMIFSAPTHEEALERAAQELGVPVSALETEILEDNSETADGEDEAGVCLRVCVGIDFLANKAVELLEGLLKAMDIEATTEVAVDDGVINIQVQAEKGSILIGREGHSLDAVQHWVSRALARESHSSPSLVIDVENYRKRKFDKLRATAVRAAERVRGSGESYKLNAMGPIERKFVHNALKDVEGVTTFSVGREGRRSVVVEPTESPESTEEPDARDDKDVVSNGIILDHSDMPEDDLISDESALSQLGAVASSGQEETQPIEPVHKDDEDSLEPPRQVLPDEDDGELIDELH